MSEFIFDKPLTFQTIVNTNLIVAHRSYLQSNTYTRYTREVRHQETKALTHGS
jgi:hypothetical protein